MTLKKHHINTYQQHKLHLLSDTAQKYHIPSHGVNTDPDVVERERSCFRRKGEKLFNGRRKIIILNRPLLLFQWSWFSSSSLFHFVKIPTVKFPWKQRMMWTLAFLSPSKIPFTPFPHPSIRFMQCWKFLSFFFFYLLLFHLNNRFGASWEKSSTFLKNLVVCYIG